MSRKRIKQYLMLLTVVGLVAVVGQGSGTFASFSATTTNDGNTFATGTLFLHNTPNGGTECDSEGTPANDNVEVTGCSMLFDNIALVDGQVTSSEPLTLTNAGTIDAANIQFSVSPACSVGTNELGVNGTGSSVTFGTAPDCGEFQIAVQEVSAGSGSPSNLHCALGNDTSNACVFASGKTLAAASTGTPTALDINTTGGTNAVNLLEASKSRFFVVEVKPVLVGTDNVLQNRKVSFGLTWTINQ